MFGSFSSWAGVPYVVQVSIDGLGAVYLREYVTNAPNEFPNFVRLVNEGSYTFNARCDFGASETIPNHTCMFTGRPALQPEGFPNDVHHGQLNNSPPETATYHNTGNTNIPYVHSIFDVMHDHGFSTAFFAGKVKLRICDRSYDSINGALDVFGEDNGRDKIDFSLIDDFADYYGNSFTNEVNAFIEQLNSAVPKHYNFIHIAEPDITGHFSGGWGSVNYSNMVRKIDQQLGRIISVIDSNSVLSNRTVLLVTTDHGGAGFGHSDPTYWANYIIPFLLRGPGVPAGGDVYSLFTNRREPEGTNRLDYLAVPQPLRNGDSGNLVLALMGLPPISGSLMRPMLSSSFVALGIGASHDGILLSWSALANDLVLQHKETIEGVWETVTQGITVVGSLNTFRPANSLDTGFYRLFNAAIDE